jgi:hypothetical protein
MQQFHLGQKNSLDERLTQEAERLHQQAKLLGPGALREAVLRKARQTENACDINKWLSSPGLRAPT